MSETGLSPSLQVVDGWASEVKFGVSRTVAGEIKAWAKRALQPDAHARPERDGAYAIETLYFDTAAQDVFYRSPGYRVAKYRIRRYEGEVAFLECKRKRGCRVQKRRELVPMPLATLHDSAWFTGPVAVKGLLPACLVRYHRHAFFGSSESGPVRLTIDDGLAAAAATDWSFIGEGFVSLPSDVQILELKFSSVLPRQFRELIREFGIVSQGFSKYRTARGLLLQAEGGEAACPSF